MNREMRTPGMRNARPEAPFAIAVSANPTSAINAAVIIMPTDKAARVLTIGASLRERRSCMSAG